MMSDTISEIVVCRECSYASHLSEWKPRSWLKDPYREGILGWCPNPACWGGMPEYNGAMAQWESAKGAYIAHAYAEANAKNYSYNFSGTALGEQFERANPRPQQVEFKRSHRGYAENVLTDPSQGA